MSANDHPHTDSSRSGSPTPVLRWQLVPAGVNGNDAPMLVATWSHADAERPARPAAAAA
jgi:hypothetical protein